MTFAEKIVDLLRNDLPGKAFELAEKQVLLEALNENPSNKKRYLAERFAKEAMSKWPDLEPLGKKELFDECLRQRSRIIKLQKQNIELLKLILQSETERKAGGD